MKDLQTSKAEALKNYKEAKADYLKTRSELSWVNFCTCKKICMMLGVRI